MTKLAERNMRVDRWCVACRFGAPWVCAGVIGAACNVAERADYSFGAEGGSHGVDVPSRGGEAAGNGSPAASGAAGDSDGGSGGHSAAGGKSGNGGAPNQGGMAAAGAGGKTLVGGSAGSGGSAESGSSAGAAGAANGGDAGGTPEDECTEERAIVCAGVAQKDRLECQNGQWVPTTSCGAEENCSGEPGECRPIASGCEDRTPGASFCDGDVVITCGADLVSRDESDCDGTCVEDGATAQCVPPGCPDGVVQPPEQCDDGNDVGADGCSPSCRGEAVQLSGGRHTCALGANGMLKCWGVGCGIGLETYYGTDFTDTLADLPAVNVGTGVHVTAVTVGQEHTCALLDDKTVKCWGNNRYYQLGSGDHNSRGCETGSMGDNLKRVELGEPVLAVSAGNGHTCALLESKRVKCWGYNSDGRLGIGDTRDRGGSPDDMGENLPYALPDNGYDVVALSVGNYHACVLLEDDGVECWGSNSHGQLGLGDTEPRGGSRESLINVRVALGTGRYARAIAAGSMHTCALLDNYQVKCWGDNQYGQLGLGDTVPRHTPPSQTVNLGTGRQARALIAGDLHTCALLDDDTVKCWGDGRSGQLGQGDPDPRGDGADMGDALPPIDFGTGRTAKALFTGDNYNCALLDDGSVKCWGDAFEGRLGLGNQVSRGNAPDQMGDFLPALDISF